MLYARIDPDTGAVLEWPLSEGILRRRLRHVSLPAGLEGLDGAALAPHGYAGVPASPADLAPPGHRVVLGQPVRRDGAWRRVWDAVPLEAGDIAALMAEVRRERDRRLFVSDITVIRAAEAGTALSAPWRAYRQALRDIPQTFAGRPWDLDWPTAPRP